MTADHRRPRLAGAQSGHDMATTPGLRETLRGRENGHFQGDDPPVAGLLLQGSGSHRFRLPG